MFKLVYPHMCMCVYNRISSVDVVADVTAVGGVDSVNMLLLVLMMLLLLVLVML